MKKAEKERIDAIVKTMRELEVVPPKRVDCFCDGDFFPMIIEVSTAKQIFDHFKKYGKKGAVTTINCINTAKKPRRNRAEFRDNSVFRYHKVKIDTFGHYRSEVSWTFEGLEIERCIIN